MALDKSGAAAASTHIGLLRFDSLPHEIWQVVELLEGPAQVPPQSIVGWPDLAVASANVLSIGPKQDNASDRWLQGSARRSILAEHSSNAKLHHLGFQETSARHGCRIICWGSLVVGSVADTAGQGCCELWVHRALGVQAKCVVVLAEDPRLLLCTLPLSIGLVDVAVAHAPCSPRALEKGSAIACMVGEYLEHHLGQALILTTPDALH